MGTMTVADDMTRLRGEIGASRSARKDFVNGVKDDVKEMKENALPMMADIRAGMKDIRNGLKDMRADMTRMLADFHKTHSEMAKGTKADRQAFVSKLSDTVHRLRKGFAADMAGAHRAFFGTAAERRAARKPAQAARKPSAPKKAKTKK